jgi:hypothetical protein
MEVVEAVTGLAGNSGTTRFFGNMGISGRMGFTTRSSQTDLSSC